MGFFTFFGIFLCISAFSVRVLGKECTNIPTQLSSYTFRYELLSSTNQSWRDEVFSYYHLTLTDDYAWMKLLRRKLLSDKGGEELDRAMLYSHKKKPGGSKTLSGRSSFLKEVSLQDVRLDSGSIHGQAQQTNLEYVLMLDVDSLVWSFKKTAGLATPGIPYGGWEANHAS